MPAKYSPVNSSLAERVSSDFELEEAAALSELSDDTELPLSSQAETGEAETPYLDSAIDADDEDREAADELDAEAATAYADGYSIELEAFERKDATHFEIGGWIANRTDTVWTAEYLLGIRNFRDASGELIKDAEFRGVMSEPLLRPGQVAHFSATIDPALIPPEAVSCEVDMVREGWFWFVERGATPVTVPVEGFRNPNSRGQATTALSRLAMTASAAERKKIAIIQQSLRSHDFSRYDRVRELRKLLTDRQHGLPYRQPPVSSKSITASLGKGLGGQRRDSFFQAFATRISEGKAPPAETPLDQLGAFKRFVRESHGFFRGSTPPFPVGFARWLSGRALPVELSPVPISRSMIAAMGGTAFFNLERMHDFRNLMWQYATSVMIDGKLPADLLPDTIVRELATSAPSADPEEQFPEPTGFMQRLLSEDQNYANRYETATAGGRCSYAFDLLLLAMDNEVRRTFLSEDVLAWMTEPVGPSLSASPFEILAMANMGWHGLSYLAGPEEALPEELRILRESYDWLPAVTPAESFAVRVIGRHSSQSGLGTNMRMTIRALESLGLAVEVVDCDIDRVIPADPAKLGRTSRPVEIYHLNCDDVPALVSRYASHTRLEPYRIAFTLWEASVMPEQHRAGAMLMDELWVPTSYLKQVYEDAGFDNVRVVGKGIDISSLEPVSRIDYGLDKDEFVFVTSFDLDSWVERKNPAAVVEAFARAFPNDAKVRLVIKTTGIFAHPGDRNRQVARLLAAADADPRIMLINERMPFGRYLGLIQMADALISSHRSEGFGYLPAYAMMLDRPVIVTDHSGTQDFCDADTAFPVASDLVPIPQGDFVYEVKGAHWADISVKALAEEMHRVRNNAAERDRRAATGMARVNALYSYDALAERYRQRLEAIG